MNMDKNKTPLNDKGERHGYWERYTHSKLWYKCFFHNDKEVGYEETYWYRCDCVIIEKKYNI